MDGRGVYHGANPFCNVAGALPKGNLRPQPFQLFRQFRAFCVRAGNAEIFLQQDFSKAAHADAADSDKVKMNWFFKVDFVHIFLPAHSFFLYYLYFILLKGILQIENAGERGKVVEEWKRLLEKVV